MIRLFTIAQFGGSYIGRTVAKRLLEQITAFGFVFDVHRDANFQIGW